NNIPVPPGPNMGGIGPVGAHPVKNTAPAAPTKMSLGKLLIRPPVFIFTYNDTHKGRQECVAETLDLSMNLKRETGLQKTAEFLPSL
ncbi:MAG: hypothetical protein J7K53_03335, partial [Bacteroidales bacterium]|nr:hypothetical protein [Bacteroidales bacterium]